jgi:hypothetical protein
MYTDKLKPLFGIKHAEAGVFPFGVEWRHRDQGWRYLSIRLRTFMMRFLASSIRYLLWGHFGGYRFGYLYFSQAGSCR